MKTNWKLMMFSLFVIGMLAIPMIAAVGEQLSSAFTDVFGESWGTILQYIFGHATGVTDRPISNVIITIAVWLLIMVTFGDIIASFSSFSKWVSWSVGFLIGIIAANLGWVTSIFAWLTGAFAVLGGLAVYAGLGTAFAAFLIVNFGITWAAPWIMGRKAMMIAAKTEVGAKDVAAGIRGMKEVSRSFRKESGDGF